MGVSQNLLLISVVLLTAGHETYAEYDVNAYCSLVRDNTKLASIDACQTYYVCRGNVATKQTCLSNQSFDKDAQTCRPKSQVKCSLEMSCAGVESGFVAIKGTCGGWIYCSKGVEIGRGQCEKGQYFRNGKCDFGTCDDVKNNGAGLQSVCDIMPNNIFFGSTRDCKTWQRCENGHFNSNPCPNDFVFDVQNQVCNYKKGDMCSRVTGEDIQPDVKIHPCSDDNEGEMIPSETDCTKYLKCTSKLWTPIQCPSGQYYDVNAKKCKSRQIAVTTPKCDRCKGTKNQFVNAIDGECKKYVICKNGVGHSEGTCSENQYFDEDSETCVQDELGDNKKYYSKTHGACQ